MKACLRWAVPVLVLLVGIGKQPKTLAAPAADQRSFERAFKVTGAVELAVKTGSEDLNVQRELEE